MAKKKPQPSRVIFLDEDKSTIQVWWDDETSDIHTYIRDDLKFLKDFSEIDIEEATIVHRRLESDRAARFEQFMSGEAVSDPANILKAELTKEQLFALKISVFEDDAVRAADRKTKATIRKSEDIVELFYYLHKLRIGES